jgi:hypothetical protein
MKHKHHIIPRHAGGTDDPSNIVYLTVKQHAEAHKKLFKKYGRWQDKLAYEGLSGQIGKEEIIQEIYKNRKNRTGAILSEETKLKISMTKKGKKASIETRNKISQSLMGHKQPESQKIKVAKALSKDHIITDPKGKTFTITNLNQFARQNNLDQGNLTKVAQGKLRQHKGYKVRYK